jgi:hypothetical protein
MPTLTRDRRSDTDIKLKDLDLPKIDLPKVELPKIDLSKVDLSKVEIPKFERPTPDELGKAVAAAATTVGLAKARPRRWPYLVAAALAIGTLGWVAMNWSTIRARLDGVAARINQRMTTAQGGESWDDAVAFTSAQTRPIESSLDAVEPTDTTLDDYPAGLGVTREPIGSSRS